MLASKLSIHELDFEIIVFADGYYWKCLTRFLLGQLTGSMHLSLQSRCHSER